MKTEPLIVPKITLPGQGRVIRAFGDEVIMHLKGEHTGGTLSLWTNITPPGGGPPPPYHDNEDEWFVVQEGRMSFIVDGQRQEVTAGGAVFAPRGPGAPLSKQGGANPSGE